MSRARSAGSGANTMSAPPAPRRWLVACLLMLLACSSGCAALRRGEADTNSRSIGIEIVNPGHEWGYRDFPEAQINAVITLSQDILARHDIPARNVIGHCDVAPERKTDPGELFPWSRLAEKGIGIMPPEIRDGGQLLVATGDEGEAVKSAQLLLKLIGFNSEVNTNWDNKSQLNMTAFQRHFYTRRLDGLVDGGGLQALQMVAEAMKN